MPIRINHIEKKVFSHRAKGVFFNFRFGNDDSEKIGIFAMTLRRVGRFLYTYFK